MQAPLLNRDQYTQIKHHGKVIYITLAGIMPGCKVLQLFPSEQRREPLSNRRKQRNWFQLQLMEIRSIAFQEELLIPLMHLIFPSTIFIMVSWSVMSSRKEVMITNLSY